ncbi:hypothetical protein HMPREF0973_02865 [Prevotella veroralis F0319]|uniref:Uncharacterized protein n=1 Tax=Prevotella veroralis F0319 TaxID=649761 RepID=C9MT94_9BACT|nr:hypothetical protein HMPREF0973_02865 [Prevotella veroralis F0319]
MGFPDDGVCPYFEELSLIGNIYPNQLSLGTPPLRGGWEGGPDEGVCPYFVVLRPTE